MTKSPVGSLPISMFSSESVLRVDPSANLATVASTLVAADVGLVVVGLDESVDGVISERDVVRAVAAQCDPHATTAVEIAHHGLVWCDNHADVADVAEEMMRNYVRHVLVEQDGYLVGVVSARDLLGAYVAAELEDA